MTEQILKQIEEKMKKSVNSFHEELKTVRTGRPNPDIFKKVKVECYGSSMNLSDIASISVPDGQSFLIKPFDKSNLKALESGISNSGLGFNPTNDGECIRIVVPPLSKERRDDLAKHVTKLAEEKGKVPIRRIRQDGKDQLKKLKDQNISEDEIKKLQDRLEKLTNKYIEEIDDLAKKKEVELHNF